MSTRSIIGVVNEDSTVTGIYCHFDGYETGVGATLRTHYTDPAKIAELMALGDLSSLGDEIGEQTDFNAPDREGVSWCRAYGRDRGESGTEASKFHSIASFLRWDAGAAYAYLFLNGAWQSYKL